MPGSFLSIKQTFLKSFFLLKILHDILHQTQLQYLDHDLCSKDYSETLTALSNECSLRQLLVCLFVLLFHFDSVSQTASISK